MEKIKFKITDLGKHDAIPTSYSTVVIVLLVGLEAMYRVQKPFKRGEYTRSYIALWLYTGIGPNPVTVLRYHVLKSHG